jgi:hypothetical protein
MRGWHEIWTCGYKTLLISAALFIYNDGFGYQGFFSTTIFIKSSGMRVSNDDQEGPTPDHCAPLSPSDQKIDARGLVVFKTSTLTT